MDTELELAQQQIQRALINGLSLSGARLGRSPVLTLAECRELSRQTPFSVDDLCREFVGFETGYEDMAEAMHELRAAFVDALTPMLNWIEKRLNKIG